MLGHETSLRFKNTEILQTTFFDHCMMLEINNRRKTGKLTNIWKFENTLLTMNQRTTHKGNEEIFRNE